MKLSNVIKMICLCNNLSTNINDVVVKHVCPCSKMSKKHDQDRGTNIIPYNHSHTSHNNEG